MKPMRFFIDTHDTASKTFPAGLAPADLEGFIVKYEEACRAEDVVLLRVHAGLEAGRAFCFTMAPDADAVRRAHERVGLPFEEITEVMTATPGDTFFRRAA
ncbi:MAG: DUF4242 domain-containing protein [Bradyrhizobium sp.]|uniref:DUF4242 domain-containing protein n=1 Tax=Bradyrhizobium sp. TaxID=376 RepID=UPI0025C2EB2D|nr:DUF4242 domain-containing protein [Bradyrhizobium sp.]MBI5263575.1 DUF4242 domain-containing protein [Bradyrhizobium sp.]